MQASGPLDQLQVLAPGEDVAVYPVMALPPFEAGAAHVIVAWPLPGPATTVDGAPGTGIGTAAPEGDDPGPVPTVFVAVTVNVYGLPFVRPLTEQASGPLDQLHWKPPGELVAV